MNVCGKCGGSGVYLQVKGPQVGMYCDSCGAWIKWVSKSEQQIYRVRGTTIYAQGVEVKLKGTNMGVSITEIGNNFSMGVENDTVMSPFDNSQAVPKNQNFGGKPDINIELEIERRVKEELSKMNLNSSKPIVEMSNIGVEEKVENKDNSEYCPICDGSPLVAESGNKVEVSIFSGVMTVTNLDGTEILGLYRLKNCPNCGKIF